MAALADEAHGAHFYFGDDMPAPAMRAGADMSAVSMHKTGGSLTQSSLLHLRGGRADVGRLESNLQMAQNTSPSYLLMASLDLARSRMATQGRATLDRLIRMSDAARKALAVLPGIEVLGEELIGEAEIAGYDPIRLVVSARRLGLEGYELYRLLRERYNIEIEFGDFFYGICVLGLGTVQADVDRLLLAMKDISQRYRGQRKPLSWDEALPPAPPAVVTPRAAHFAGRVRVPRREAAGRICAQMIVPYPPGIPVVCPGELLTEEVCAFLEEQVRKNRHLHGLREEDGVAVLRE
jgi:arginine/lysine/ornithine decarboxylase